MAPTNENRPSDAWNDAADDLLDVCDAAEMGRQSARRNADAAHQRAATAVSEGERVREKKTAADYDGEARSHEMVLAVLAAQVHRFRSRAIVLRNVEDAHAHSDATGRYVISGLHWEPQAPAAPWWRRLWERAKAALR